MSESWDTLLAGLFEPEVAAAASPITASLQNLSPDERAAIAAWAPRRQHEFATGRACARRLLSTFGVGAARLPASADGSPDWPPGFVGSISHTDGLCVAAVARRDSVAGVGIDVEVANGLDETTWDLVCTPTELSWLRAQSDPEHSRLLATVLFSAKESTHKCLAGRDAGPFEPRAIEVQWDGQASSFSARLVQPPSTVDFEGTPAPAVLSGRVFIRQRWVLTGVTRPALPGSGPDVTRSERMWGGTR